MTEKERPRVLVMGGGLTEQLARAGAESVYIPSHDKRAAEAASHESIHALVLTGGSDVSPALYGAKRDKQTQSPDNARDEAEVRALHAAFKRGIPIFGICRGSQMINVAFGGTLHQHIESVGAHRWHLGHDHRVNLKRGSRVAISMATKQPWVVSIHHQAVDKIADGFHVTAKSSDGIAEAIESKPNSGLPWIVGTQFHPEISTNLAEQSLFDELVFAAARAAGLPEPEPFVPAVNVGVVKTAVHHKPTPIEPYGKMDWFCFRCGVPFDTRADHVDHMYLIHDVDLVPLMSERGLNEYLDEVGVGGIEYTAIEERWLAGV